MSGFFVEFEMSKILIITASVMCFVNKERMQIPLDTEIEVPDGLGKYNLSEDDVNRIVNAGAGKLITPVEQDEPAVDAGHVDLVALIDAIDTDDENNFIGSGAPTVEALSQVAGVDVTADQRDAEWAIYLDSAE